MRAEISVAQRLRDALAHPLARGVRVDDSGAIPIRREILRNKRFLRMVYEEWYRTIASHVPAGRLPVLELGSGPSFFKESLPDALATDIQWEPTLDLVLDGMYLPLSRNSLRAIVMTNVLHHLSDVRFFFECAGRAVQRDGVIVMIEPWVTWWARLVYRFHQEPFEPRVPEWQFPSSGPLSGANGALPWVVLERDRAVFEREFAVWRIERIEPMMPLLYLLSGGVSLRSLVPAWSFRWWKGVEQALGPFRPWSGMFALIVLRKDRAGS
jgi:SAM-dependent methyltransferase